MRRYRAGCKDRPICGKLFNMLLDIHPGSVLRWLLRSVKVFRRDIGEMKLDTKIVFAAAQVPSIFYRSLGGLYKCAILYIRVEGYVNDPFTNLLFHANMPGRIKKKIC